MRHQNLVQHNTEEYVAQLPYHTPEKRVRSHRHQQPKVVDQDYWYQNCSSFLKSSIATFFLAVAEGEDSIEQSR